MMDLKTILTVDNVVMGIAAICALFLVAKIMKTALYAIYGCLLSIAVYKAAGPLLTQFVPQITSIPYGATAIPAIICIAVSLCFCQMILEIRVPFLRVIVALLLLFVFSSPLVLSIIFP
jgi:hypothetical protein